MREPAKSFQDLIVWQKAHAFVLSTHAFTQSFPKHELYGLTSQLRRAAISIPANIAEGFRKQSANDKARFLNISEGSLEECRYYLILARDLSYIPAGKFQSTWNQSEEIGRLLNGYRSSVLKNKGRRNA